MTLGSLYNKRCDYVYKERKGEEALIMKKKTWIGIILFLAFAAFVGYSIYSSSQEDDTVTVRTAEVTEDAITETVVTTGTIEPSQTQEVMGQGIVSELFVELGDTVEEGDTLVTYLDGTSFTANFNGTVTQLNIAEEEPDANAQQGQASLVLSNLDDLEVSLDLSRSDVGLVSEGQDVLLTYGENEYEGTVEHIDPVATAQQTQMGATTTLGAIVSFDSDTKGLIAGFDIDVDIIVDSNDSALILPIEALNHDEDNQPYVYVLDGTVLNEVAIETGIQSDTVIEVTDGLSSGDEVVLSPSEELEDGMEVERED